MKKMRDTQSARVKPIGMHRKDKTEEEEEKTSHLQKQLTTTTLKVQVKENMKRLENINKAEHKYWKNTSQLSRQEGQQLVRNRSAKERLRINTSGGAPIIQQVQHMSPRQQQTLGQAIDG